MRGPTCNVCRHSNCRTMAILTSEVDGREYRAVRCEECGMLFAWPLPELDLGVLQDVYGGSYAERQRQPKLTEEGMRLHREAGERQARIVERHVDKGKALNVGAMDWGVGILEERGWQLRCVEVSRWAAEAARREWGREVVVSRIEDYQCLPGDLDFVKLGHVIEHLRDPRSVLVKVREMLRPGGVVLIDTDDAQGFRTAVETTARRVLGERQAAHLVRALVGKNLGRRYGRLTPPVHNHIFTKSALAKMLEETGFDVLQTFNAAWGDPTWFPLADLDNFSFVERLFIRIDRMAARMGRGEVLGMLARRL